MENLDNHVQATRDIDDVYEAYFKQNHLKNKETQTEDFVHGKWIIIIFLIISSKMKFAIGNSCSKSYSLFRHCPDQAIISKCLECLLVEVS